MRNPQGSQGCTVTTLHDHRPGLTSHNQKATAFADWPDRSVGQNSGGQPRLKSLSNMCDGSPSRVSSKTLAQESKPEVAGILDDPSAGLAGARGLRSSKMPYRGGAARNVREHGSRERRNGTGEHQHGHNRSQNIQTQTIQAGVVHNSTMVYPIEQNYVTSPAPQICDLLQFLEKATPQLQVPPGTTFQDLTLEDVWSTMRDASLFGLDVPTCGSVLGRSSAYFVPLLSAMKLFTRGHNRSRRKEDDTSQARGSSRSSKCRYRGSEPCWPAEIDLLASHHAQHLPWDRQPLYHELQAMANQAPSDLIPDPQQLLHTPLHLIHPSSWICVWWQPLYRIPDMPLDAKFLVYYSFEAVWNPPPPEHHTPFQLHITGLLTGGVEVHSSDGGASSGERWLRVPRGGDEDADTVHQHTMFEGKLQELLAHLHTRAQQLTCNCDHAVEIVAKDGSVHDDEGHKDFNFLQRGRLGFSNGVME